MKALDKDGLDYVVDKIYDVVNSGGSADYIVEEGTATVGVITWTYRKWASGLAECFGSHTKTHAITQAWGGVFYESDNTYFFTYPANLFISPPKVFASVTDSSGTCWLMDYGSGNVGTKTRTPSFAFGRGTSNADIQLSLNVEAKGLWKEFTPSVSHEHATMQTGAGTKTSSVASFERCYWQKFGNLVFVAFTFTAASSGITVTSQFFTGLPKPVSYFRFSGTLGNTSKSCRLSMNADGTISNAYTVVGDIQGGVVDGSVVYFTKE